MSGFSIRQFKGIAPRTDPLLLADNQAQTANNCTLRHGVMTPLSANLAVAATLAKAGTKKTIYRFGHLMPSELQYWFHWLDDVDVCKGQIFGDTSERTYYTGDSTNPPQVTNATMMLSGGGTLYPNASYTLGIPQPAATLLAVPAGTGTGIAETRVYTYTYVSAWGEEGLPATASALVSVLPGQTVSLSNFSSAPVGVFNIATKRIYRSLNGSYFFVAEIPVAVLTYSDAVLGENLSALLPSATYDMPPATLIGLTNMANGIMAGFSGSDIYFCEPFKPYAWPLGYVQTVDFNIVALGATDTSLIVLTSGTPYLIQGSHPANMGMVQINNPYPCMSKRSVCKIAGGIIYASPAGLVLVSGAGAVVVTESLFTNKEWSALFTPSSIYGYVYDGRYIGFYITGGVQAGFIFDLYGGEFTTFDWYATAGYYDPQLDALYLVVAGALVKFDKGITFQTAIWKTKKFYLSRPVNMSFIRIEAAAYPVSVQVFADGISIGTFSIISPYAQRLPSGFLANTWEISVTSAVNVNSIGIAQSIEELANG